MGRRSALPGGGMLLSRRHPRLRFGAGPEPTSWWSRRRVHHSRTVRSGKTTILRLVGGFTQPTGTVRFAAEDITKVPTHKRPFNTVFQDYALFPHMNVARNVGCGLMLRGLAKGGDRAPGGAPLMSSASPACWTVIPTSFRRAAPARRACARSFANRGFSCSTSRWRHLTPSSGGRCRSS